MMIITKDLLDEMRRNGKGIDADRLYKEYIEEKLARSTEIRKENANELKKGDARLNYYMRKKAGVCVYGNCKKKVKCGVYCAKHKRYYIENNREYRLNMSLKR